jgi:hypothetical protein
MVHRTEIQSDSEMQYNNKGGYCVDRLEQKF